MWNTYCEELIVELLDKVMGDGEEIELIVELPDEVLGDGESGNSLVDVDLLSMTSWIFCPFPDNIIITTLSDINFRDIIIWHKSKNIILRYLYVRFLHKMNKTMNCLMRIFLIRYTWYEFLYDHKSCIAAASNYLYNK